MKNIARSAAALAVLVLTGCIDLTSMVVVKKDGSGYVVETMYLGNAADQMMQQMAAGMGAETGAGMSSGMVTDIEQYKTKATQMGDGVTFVSAKEVTRADGAKGVNVIYAFKDVRTLKVNSEPDAPSPQPGAAMAEPEDSAPAGGSFITFGFEDGPSPTLTVFLPEEQATDPATDDMAMFAEEAAEPAIEEDDDSEGEEELPDAFAEQQEAMMKQMFTGFRMRMIVKVDGEIIESNASHMWAGKTQQQKQYVTLFDVDIGRLIKEGESLDKLSEMGDSPDIQSALEDLQGIPGITIEPAKKVSIRFR